MSQDRFLSNDERQNLRSFNSSSALTIAFTEPADKPVPKHKLRFWSNTERHALKFFYFLKLLYILFVLIQSQRALQCAAAHQFSHAAAPNSATVLNGRSGKFLMPYGVEDLWPHPTNNLQPQSSVDDESVVTQPDRQPEFYEPPLEYAGNTERRRARPYVDLSDSPVRRNRYYDTNINHPYKSPFITAEPEYVTFAADNSDILHPPENLFGNNKRDHQNSKSYQRRRSSPLPQPPWIRKESGQMPVAYASHKNTNQYDRRQPAWGADGAKSTQHHHRFLSPSAAEYPRKYQQPFEISTSQQQSADDAEALLAHQLKSRRYRLEKLRQQLWSGNSKAFNRNSQQQQSSSQLQNRSRIRKYNYSHQTSPPVNAAPAKYFPRPLTPSQRRQLIQQQFSFATTTTTTAPKFVISEKYKDDMKEAQDYDENSITAATTEANVVSLLGEFYNRFSSTTTTNAPTPNSTPPVTQHQECLMNEQCVQLRSCLMQRRSSFTSSFTMRSCTTTSRASYGQGATRAGGICCPVSLPLSTVSAEPPPLPSSSSNRVTIKLLKESKKHYDVEPKRLSPADAESESENDQNRPNGKNWYSQTLDKYYSWLKNKWSGSAKDTVVSYSTTTTAGPSMSDVETSSDLAASSNFQHESGTNHLQHLSKKLLQSAQTTPSSSLLDTLKNAYETFVTRKLVQNGNNIDQPTSAVKDFQLSNGKTSAVNSQHVCGERRVLRSPRILGGRETAFGEWPWTAIVNVFGKQRCGGALINEQYVVTAAHCLYYFSLLSWFPGLSVVLGEHNRNDEAQNPMPALSVEVAAVFLHPDYVHKTKSHDVALIKLKKPLEFVGNIQPICLPSKTFTDRYATVMGWGKRSYSDTIDDLPDVPYQVDLQIHSPRECLNMLRTSGAHLIGGYGPEFLCAGGESGKDACRGDSGGPLMIRNLDSSQFEIVGLVSKGFGCGEVGIPGLYTNLLFLRGWIEDTIKKNSL